MGFSNVKGISVASGFKLQAEAPLDARFIVDSIEDRDELVTINAAYYGLVVYVKNDKSYTYTENGWVANLTGSMYTHPTTSGNRHIPSGGTVGQFLTNVSDGTVEWKSILDATPLVSGFMSTTDKAKLDAIEEEANKYIHPSTHPATMIVEDESHRFVTDIDKTNWSDKYSKNEIDNKFSTMETNIDWKESVNTFADIIATYPSPQDGWTVNTKDDNVTWRYNGTEWVPISSNAIPNATSSVDGLMSKSDKIKLDSVEMNANNYIHPSYNAKDNGLYKVTVDDTGHVSTVVNVSKADITNLGIPAQDTTYDLVTTTINGLMTSVDKVKLDGIEENANNYTHPTTHPATMIVEDETHRFITDEERTKWSETNGIYVGSSLPDDAPVGSVLFFVE